MVDDTAAGRDRAPLFEFRGVTVGGVSGPRLRGVDLAIPDHGVTVVVGPSGSGKTTLLRCCNLLEVAERGTVAHRGEDVRSFDPPVLRRRVAMVFQHPVLFPGTVTDNLAVAEPGHSEPERSQLLGRVGLDPGLSDRDSAKLSGGEAQRVCLARALATGPETVLMDEPTASLDGAATMRLERLTTGLAGAGIPVVWVTHDLAQAERLAQSLVVLLEGSVVAAGDPSEVLASTKPDVRRFLDSWEAQHDD